MRNASTTLGSPGPATRPASAEPSGERVGTVTCPHCRAVATWGTLARVNVLEGATLESHLSVRPDGWLVDVRACADCGRGFARKVRTRGADGG